MITAAEQYLIELINRARLDPQGEADRYLGGNLNQNNSGTQFTAESRQPLAGNAALHQAAANHSLHMLAVDQFEHDGIGDGTATSRMSAAGYTFSGTWSSGENISVRGTTGTIDLNSAIESHHSGLFQSIGHRRNILNDNFREIGIGQEAGQFSGFTNDPRTYNASMLTENFARTGNDYFVTGVLYNDTNNNDFYSIGEGVGGSTVSVSGVGSDTSEAAGGYAVDFGGTSGARQVSARGMTVTVTLGSENIKLDFLNGGEIHSSASVSENSGVSQIKLLGVENISAAGAGGAETLVGNSGNNALNGNGGNDTLIGGLGADALNGGAGTDTASYANAGSGLLVDMLFAFANNGEAAGDTYISIENLAGSAFADSLRGTNGNNRIDGNNGNDSLLGRAGQDQLFGGNGNDALIGGTGADVLNGGAGSDSASYFQSTTNVTVNMATGARSGEALGDVFISIENLVGSTFGDSLTGDGAANILAGYLGNDFLNGGNGADFLYGSIGNDTMVGGNGIDRLFGGTGNDTLLGGFHGDILFGAGGADTFRFDSVSDSVAATNQLDRILDFNRGQGDRVNVSAIDANTLAGGNQAFSFIGTNAAFSSAGQLRFNSGNSHIQADVNGDGIVDFSVLIDGAGGFMQASDFVL